ANLPILGCEVGDGVLRGFHGVRRSLDLRGVLVDRGGRNRLGEALGGHRDRAVRGRWCWGRLDGIAAVRDGRLGRGGGRGRWRVRPRDRRGRGKSLRDNCVAATARQAEGGEQEGEAFHLASP